MRRKPLLVALAAVACAAVALAVVPHFLPAQTDKLIKTPTGNYPGGSGAAKGSGPTAYPLETVAGPYTAKFPEGVVMGDATGQMTDQKW